MVRLVDAQTDYTVCIQGFTNGRLKSLMVPLQETLVPMVPLVVPLVQMIPTMVPLATNGKFSLGTIGRTPNGATVFKTQFIFVGLSRSHSHYQHCHVYTIHSMFLFEI